MNIQSLSVVIPTLAGPSLNIVVNSINNGTEIPKEILICVPRGLKQKINLDDDRNIKIIESPKGQVFQRIEGFKNAKCPLVLQIDDDCIISNKDLISMVSDLLELGEGNAIAPIYYNEITNKCSHPFITGFRGLFKSTIATFVCGASWGLKRMGTISKIGTNYGVDVNYMDSTLKETEWVPGGCVLHYNNSTIKDNYFPFSGKAFCEDLMHSCLLRQKNIKLWITKNASCKTEHAYFPDNKVEIKQYLEAFKHLQKIRNKKVLRFWIWYFINLLRIWIKFNIKKEENVMPKVGIIINQISYTPEAYAYTKYLRNKGFVVDLNYKGKLEKNNDITINFMGFRPFWKNFFSRNIIEIHEYTSLSTKPLSNA